MTCVTTGGVRSKSSCVALSHTAVCCRSCYGCWPAVCYVCLWNSKVRWQHTSWQQHLYDVSLISSYAINVAKKLLIRTTKQNTSNLCVTVVYGLICFFFKNVEWDVDCQQPLITSLIIASYRRWRLLWTDSRRPSRSLRSLCVSPLQQQDNNDECSKLSKKRVRWMILPLLGARAWWGLFWSLLLCSLLPLLIVANNDNNERLDPSELLLTAW
jgi:hypothetical protein